MVQCTVWSRGSAMQNHNFSFAARGLGRSRPCHGRRVRRVWREFGFPRAKSYCFRSEKQRAPVSSERPSVRGDRESFECCPEGPCERCAATSVVFDANQNDGVVGLEHSAQGAMSCRPRLQPSRVMFVEAQSSAESFRQSSIHFLTRRIGSSTRGGEMSTFALGFLVWRFRDERARSTLRPGLATRVAVLGCGRLRRIRAEFYPQKVGNKN